MPSAFQPIPYASASSQSRRLLIIPALFLLLILITLGYTIQSLETQKSQVASLELVTRQRALRARYLRDFLLESHGGGRTAYREEGREVERILELLGRGGSLYVDPYRHPIIIPPPPNPKIAAEIQRKRQLFSELQNVADRLLTLRPGTSEYQAALGQMGRLNTSMDDPPRDLLSQYIAEASRRIYALIWLEVLVLLLTGGLGIALTLQHRVANRQLAENEERFRQIFHAAPIGKALVTPEGCWFDVNPAMCNMLGYSESELIGKNFEDLIFADDYYRKMPIREPLLKGEIGTDQMTHRYIHKDGSLIWVLATVAAVRASDGHPQYLVVQLLDISESEKAMEAVQASEARYRSVIDTATDGIIIADGTGCIVSANAESCRIFGYSGEEMIGLSVSSLVSIQERTELGYSLRYLADNRALELMGRQQEMLGLHKDLGEFPLEMSLSTWRDSEGKCFYTAIIRDVSERKRIEKERQELVQSNKDLEEFALIASHDLQEPLRKIVFYTERFTHENEENLSRESLEHVSKVIGCTHRMQNLINDLLMYSRVSVRGKQFSRVALKQVVNDVLSDLECVIQETGATIRVDDLPVIEADSSQMRQLFGNLIENALKYRQAGVSPKIWIYGNVVDKQLQVGSVPLHGTGNGAAPEKARFAEIRVEDNGIGFEEKYLDRIFNVFQRLHGREQYSGTGIGLATCRRIVERHNGSITATSKPGIGSTFIVSLPVYRHHPSLQAR